MLQRRRAGKVGPLKCWDGRAWRLWKEEKVKEWGGEEMRHEGEDPSNCWAGISERMRHMAEVMKGGQAMTRATRVSTCVILTKGWVHNESSSLRG